MSNRIVISDTKVLDAAVWRDALGDLDVEIDRTAAREQSAYIEAVGSADAVIVDSATEIDATVLDALESLQVVGRAGIGVDNIDVAAAAEREITVVNVPDYCLEEVSTQALALMLGCLRRVGVYDRAIEAGDWDWSVGQPIPRLADCTIGLVAFGKIARRLASKLAGLDADLVAYDPYVSDYRMADFDVEPVGFEALLERSDLVSIHAPLTDETRGLFDADAFGRMRPGSMLVNTARGPIVDEAALYRALTDGPLAGAGLDVREEEPPGDSRLHELDQVLCSPHAAWYSEASREQLSRSIAADVARVLRGEPPRSPVSPDSGWF